MYLIHTCILNKYTFSYIYIYIFIYLFFLCFFLRVCVGFRPKPKAQYVSKERALNIIEAIKIYIKMYIMYEKIPDIVTGG